MNFKHVTLFDEPVAADVVVVIDVCRAFTTAAFALSAGVEEIYLVDTVEAAFDLRRKHPHWLLAGEVGGLPVDGFDHWNSPYEFSLLNLTGKTLVMRTSSGTQGVVRYQNSVHLLGGSFVVAKETVKWIESLKMENIVFVQTGIKPGISGQEDIACADYLRALLEGRNVSVASYLEQCRSWDPRHLATSEAMLLHLQRDFQLCTEANRFPFYLDIRKQNGHLILRRGYNEA